MKRRPRDMTVDECFNEQWIPEPNSGCHLWCGTVADTGYGKLWAFGQTKASAHRVSWILHNGPIPDGMIILHKCDVRLCVNPAHLELGTFADNTADMMQKQRHRTKPSRGMTAYQAKLTDEDVIMIRASSLPYAELGQRLNVSTSLISHVRNRRIWKHIP